MILIIGAGLGGLVTAISLARARLPVTVYEAASALTETGAGLTLGRGAQHVFRDLGLQADVAALACPAGSLPFLHYKTARLLMGTPDAGDGTPDDGGTDIVRHIYRGDLQAVMLAHAARLSIPVHTGKRLTGFEQDSASVTAHFADGSSAAGRLIVGADGIRSAVRALLHSGDAPRFTGHVAFRFLVPAALAAPFMGQGRSAIFIGPKRTFNRYTMQGGKVVNCAGLAETGEEVPEGWSLSSSIAEVGAAFPNWHPDATGLIAQAHSVIKWGLYDRKPLARWSEGRITLLGDAAHAMLPFLGMGAAMAIEDGWALARSLALEPDLAAALSRYEAARHSRCETMQTMSRRQGEMTQAMDPDTLAPSAVPMANQDLMGFNPVRAGV